MIIKEKEMIFVSRSNFKKQDPEKGSGEILVDRVGYIPPNEQINKLIAAGIRLRLNRAQYDYQYDTLDQDIVLDPSRRKNFDLADATQILLAYESRVKERNNATKKPDKTVASNQNVGSPEEPPTAAGSAVG